MDEKLKALMALGMLKARVEDIGIDEDSEEDKKKDMLDEVREQSKDLGLLLDAATEGFEDAGWCHDEAFQLTLKLMDTVANSIND